MKDSIKKYIEENRNNLDVDRPDDIVWNTIKKELHPPKRKKLGWLKVASVGLVLMAGTWYFTSTRLATKQLSKITAADSTSVLQGWNYKVPANGGFQKVDKSKLDPLANKTSKQEYFFSDQLNTNQSKKEVRVGLSELKGETFTSLTSTDVNGCVTSNQNFGTDVYAYNWSVNNTDEGLVNNQAFSNKSNSPSGLGEITDGYHKTYNSNGNIVMDGEFVNGKFSSGKHYVYDEYGLLERIETHSSTGITYQDYKKVTKTLGNKGNEYTYEFIPAEIASYYEQYDEFNENKFEEVSEEPLSTFSIDVDGAGYSNMRRFVNNGYLPPKNAVKLEEMVNYFQYDLPEPADEHPFSITTETGICPWNKEHRLLQIAIKGKSFEKKNLPANNLVFLLDVSGSMSDYDKLPLLKKGFKMLIDEMRPEDRVAIVVYAGAAGVVLPSTPGSNKETILEALNNLEAGGSTAGGEGIELAYKIAKEHYKEKGNNRIILATDGDFNVGISDDDALIELIEEKRKSGIELSVMGFGEGNLQSSKMEKIADNGNGNFSYIDNVLEAKKVFVNEMGGTLHTIAKDVKLQLEFNPSNVESYRLLGYENRMLATQDFDDDTKDAGELGAGHTIVALYEIVPANGTQKKSSLKYQNLTPVSDAELNKELVTIKFRYKKPKTSKSILMTKVVMDNMLLRNSENFRFASAVAEFGLLIRESDYKADASFDELINRAQASKGKDIHGYRAEFVRLAEQGKILMESFMASKP